MPAAIADIQVREARALDEAGLARLEAVAWSPDSGFPSVISRSGAAFFGAASPPAAHLVAERQGAVVGYIRLAPSTPLPENAHVILVAGLAVDPGARRLGVGRALLEAAEQRARERGARKLSLHVLSTNAGAQRLYDEAGFEREGVLRAEFLIEGRYVDDILLTKHLAGPAAWS
jgi:ribosomal protein S18 acetylase RimI-like enzyme